MIDGALCSVCGEPFADEDEWDDRHTDDDGGDCHADCCPACNAESRDVRLHTLDEGLALMDAIIAEGEEAEQE